MDTGKLFTPYIEHLEPRTQDVLKGVASSSMGAQNGTRASSYDVS